MILGCMTTWAVWSAFKLSAMMNVSATAFYLHTAPVSRTKCMLARLCAHWLYLTAIVAVIFSPALLVMAWSGNSGRAIGILMLLVFSLPTISLSWVVVSMLGRLVGAQVLPAVVKAFAFVVSLLTFAAVSTNRQAVERVLGWWSTDVKTLIYSGVLLAIGAGIAIIGAYSASRITLYDKQSASQAGGGAISINAQGFRAILAKEYRLLFRSMKKLVFVLLFNYILSFGVTWMLFHVVRQNETYFYVSLVMFIYGIYVALPSNMLSTIEGQTWVMLRTSPTTLRRVLLAKSVAVYSIMAPISLIMGFIAFEMTMNQQKLIVATLITGLVVCAISVWFGTIESIFKWMGHPVWKSFFVSMFILSGALLVILSTYYRNTIAIDSYTALLATAGVMYGVGIVYGVRWTKI